MQGILIQSPVPPGTCWTGSQPGFSRSPKHGSSVEISAMDFLTPKTWIVKKFQKSIRHIHFELPRKSRSTSGSRVPQRY